MKTINELMAKVTMNEDGSMIFEGKELVREILTALEEKEQFTITLNEEDLPQVGNNDNERIRILKSMAEGGISLKEAAMVIEDPIRDYNLLRSESITLDMIEKQGKKISNPHAREQGRQSEVYLNAEELNVFDYLKGAELTLRRRGPAAALMDCMTDEQQFTLHYRFLFCMQWFRVNNSEAFHVLLD